MKSMNGTNSSDTAMDMATLGERGQIVIPAAIRERLGLSPGDRLMVFTKHQEMICIVPASSMRHLVEVLNNQITEIDNEQNTKQENS